MLVYVNFYALQTYSMKDHILALGNQFYLASVDGIKHSSHLVRDDSTYL